ncbi:MAG: class I SAM-dependent methyltransferase [Betaproteobacteria bacterium]
MSDASYAGAENLEVMREAVNYNQALLDLVRRHAPKGARMLDFGAGVGTFALPLSREGHAVECVEIDAAQRQAMAAAGLIVHDSLASIDDGSVDFAYSFNVLEHIDDDAGALRDVARTLRPGGRLLVYVPAFPVLFTSMDRAVGHLRRYRRPALIALVERAALDVVTSGYVDSLGFLATLAYRVAGSREGAIDRRALRLYDRFAFPISRLADRALKHVMGKNLMVVAQKR